MLPTALDAPFTMAVVALPEFTVNMPAVVILPPVILPVTLKPEALENVAIDVGVMAPAAVVNICMFVARLASVKFSAATTSTRPVDAFPNCRAPLLNPRAVN